MRLYETVIVFDPQLKAPEIEESTKKFTNFIANHGGEIVKQDEWGKRRLAYEINRRQYGFYILLRFNGPGQLVALLEREFKLSETVLRHLTIKMDKKALQMEQALENLKAVEEQKAEDKSPKDDASPAEAAAETETASVEAETTTDTETSTDTEAETSTETTSVEEEASPEDSSEEVAAVEKKRDS